MRGGKETEESLLYRQITCPRVGETVLQKTPDEVKAILMTNAGKKLEAIGAPVGEEPTEMEDGRLAYIYRLYEDRKIYPLLRIFAHGRLVEERMGKPMPTGRGQGEQLSMKYYYDDAGKLKAIEHTRDKVILGKKNTWTAAETNFQVE